jgi:aldose 1-epimerase
LIAYEAICDKKSPINFTNHCYWNLDGEAKAKIDDLQVQINSDVWLSSVNGIPDGLIQRCESSDFDFRTPKNLKKIVENDGVDHTFILRPNQSTKCITFGSECTRFDSCTLAHKPAELNHAATIGGSLARMEVWTDKPGLQFYTGNYMPNARGRSIHLGAFQGVCAETQFFPDAPNQGSQYRLIGASLGYNVEQTKHWDSIFDSGELYRYHTLHRFT